MEMMSNNTVEQVCYVHCNFCNTVLGVNVPCNSMYNTVTVKCGHCSNLISVTIGRPSPYSSYPQDPQLMRSQEYISEDPSMICSTGSSSSSSHVLEIDDQMARSAPNPPPEKRHRVPSAYNKFIKQEIQRIKASNPDISHREAFSAAAKNWAHFPDIHLGLSNVEGQSQARLDQTQGGSGTNMSPGFH
uniref:Uncharacterized protein n=1 Tax=Opuntia streptacantha TaxID=393608 RepID=A0A7C9CFR9_OPUST